MVAQVIKRTGHSEPYSEAKLYHSLVSAALSVRALEGEAQLLAERVTKNVTVWIHGKIEVTSLDIRQAANSVLSDLHTEAAYAYDVHDYNL